MLKWNVWKIYLFKTDMFLFRYLALIVYFREEGVAFDCDDQLLDLLWSSFGVLLSDLIIARQNGSMPKVLKKFECGF